MEIDYATGNEIRNIAGASAVGMLAALVEFDRIPTIHLERVKEIIAQWDGAFDVKQNPDGTPNVD